MGKRTARSQEKLPFCVLRRFADTKMKWGKSKREISLLQASNRAFALISSAAFLCKFCTIAFKQAGTHERQVESRCSIALPDHQP